jgi:hypothetical protein
VQLPKIERPAFTIGLQPLGAARRHLIVIAWMVVVDRSANKPASNIWEPESIADDESVGLTCAAVGETSGASLSTFEFLLAGSLGWSWIDRAALDSYRSKWGGNWSR